MYREKALSVILLMIVAFSMLCSADNKCDFGSRRYGRFCKRNLRNKRRNQMAFSGLEEYRRGTAGSSRLQYPPEDLKSSYLRDLFRDDN